MNLYIISFIFLKNSFAREQYPWYGTFELADDVELLLKQGLKIRYLPISTKNGFNLSYINYLSIF